jgi:F-type H+-transporting ATPase subunit delta
LDEIKPKISFFPFHLRNVKYIGKNTAHRACHACRAMLNPRPTNNMLKGSARAVSSSNQASSVVAQRYAKALIELAEEGKNLDKVEQDLQDLAAMIQNSDALGETIRSPLYGDDALFKAMSALADRAQFQDITKNFLGVLVQNRRLSSLGAVVKAFGQALDKRRGAVSVDVQVAQDLSAKQQKDLQDALSKAMGKDVAINARVEPGILGGMIVTVGSTMIDDSVRRKLERLKVSMGGGVNENVSLKEVS